MIELLGIIAAISFAISAVPQAIKSWKEGHSRGMSLATIILWMVGEAAMLVYVLGMYPGDLILLLNYATNTLMVGIITWYAFRPRKLP